MTRPKPVALFFLLASFAPVVVAQDGRSLLPKIEQGVSAKTPEWKIDHKDAHERSVMIEWKSGDRPARLIIMIADSSKQAHDWYQGVARRAKRDIGPNGSKTRLYGLGVEAYMATDFMKKDWVTICFRRGRLYAQVYAPTEQAAKMFAQVVAEENR